MHLCGDYTCCVCATKCLYQQRKHLKIEITNWNWYMDTFGHVCEQISIDQVSKPL